MSENCSSEGSTAMNFTETNNNTGPELGTSTQAEVNEQIRSFMASLMRQLEDLIWLVQGMTTASHPNYYTKVDTSASYSAPGYQPDSPFLYHCVVRTTKNEELTGERNKDRKQLI